jgi:ATP-binding cassette subfamily B protein
VTIARAILKDSPIIILDEATACTDPENEARIQDSINSLVRGKTLLVIAHRLSTIILADQIVVLREGRVEAQGTHPELLTGCALYRQLWEAHAGAQERPGGGENHV